MKAKNLLLSNLFFFITFYSRSQIKFSEGYIINNNHERTDCMIMNTGQEESTSKYQYKLKGDKKINHIELSKIEEFGIDKQLKCIRALIPINVSPDVIKTLKDTVNQWEEEHAYLNTLVESNSASLYSYYDYGKPLFFYSINNNTIKPLIYKKYTVEISRNIIDQILFDNTYKEQLKEDLNCGDTKIDLKKVTYTKKSLVKYFTDYNKCMDAGYTVYNLSQAKRGIFAFKTGISLNNMQFIIEEFSDALPNAVFSKKNSPGYSVELEYIFPFNRYKWSIFSEANYYTYYSNTVESSLNFSDYEGFEANYKTVEFPIGINHYLNLTNKHRLLVKAAFVPHIIFKESFIAFSSVYSSDFSTSSRIFIGAGYNYDRLGVEFRYYSKQNLTMNIFKRSSEFTQLSMRVYYTLSTNFHRNKT